MKIPVSFEQTRIVIESINKSFWEFFRLSCIARSQTKARVEESLQYLACVQPEYTR